MSSSTSRLDSCGWNSFRQHLFFQDQGRGHRDIGDDIIRIITTYNTGKTILELCSGGGKLLIHLARAGFHVTGLDLSNDMLAVCNRAIKNESVAIQDRIILVQDDMCTFDLGRKFAFIILEDDGFMYLLSGEDQLSCLQRVHAHLADNGLFFLSFATPQQELNAKSEFTYDEHTQIITHFCVWNVIDDNGHEQTVREGFERRRLTFTEELEKLLKKAHLVPVHRWGDLHMHPFTDPFTQDYNYLIKKEACNRRIT